MMMLYLCVWMCVAVLLEKILRVQPNVKKLYLLLRAADAKSATHRLHNEVNAQDQFLLCAVLFNLFLIVLRINFYDFQVDIHKCWITIFSIFLETQCNFRRTAFSSRKGRIVVSDTTLAATFVTCHNITKLVTNTS